MLIRAKDRERRHPAVPGKPDARFLMFQKICDTQSGPDRKVGPLLSGTKGILAGFV